MNDTPYDGLSADCDDHRWAFGTGFEDPLEGIDTSVPEGMDVDELARRCLGLGDDALIYSHRLQQWMTRMPELEEETALANIALDLLGQARMLLARAGTILGRTEDQLAYFRVEQEFRNVRLVEHEDRDFAELVGRLLIFSTWRLATFTDDTDRSDPVLGDPVLAAIAGKAAKELTYHRDYAAQWVVRLGDGTELSHQRMQAALDRVWPYVGELHPTAEFDSVVDTVLATGGLERPSAVPLAGVGGRTGRDGAHTEAMGFVLAELQSIARTYPDARW